VKRVCRPSSLVRGRDEEREGERERVRGREREGDRGKEKEGGRKREGELSRIVVLISKGMMGALAPFSCLVTTNVCREIDIRYSALFMYFVGWHAGAVSSPPCDVILAQLACPLSDVMF
jgi:hypothetical protein